MLKKTKVKAFAFQISIPAIDTTKNSPTVDYYNNELFEGFLHEIINTGKNKLMEKGKYLKLISIKQSSDAQILEGVFHTTRYGSLNDIIDTTNDKIVNTMQPIQGVKQTVNFVINRDNGVMLIQTDSFRIISRSNLLEFFEKRKDLGVQHVKLFNQKNKPLLVSHENFYYLNTIYDEDFYAKLAEFLNIKAIEINTKVSKEEANSALSRFTLPDANTEDYIDDVTDITYTFKNKLRSQGIKYVKHFIKNSLDMEKVDSITAHGPNNEKVTFNQIKPRSYPIDTTINVNGVIDNSLIINNMIKLVKEIEI